MLIESERVRRRARFTLTAGLAAALIGLVTAPQAAHAAPATQGAAMRLAAAEIPPPPRPKPSPKGSIRESGARLTAHLAEGSPVIESGVAWSVRPYSGDGAAIVSDEARSEIELVPGRYLASAAVGPVAGETDFIVEYDKVTRVRVPLGAAMIEATVKAGAATMPIDDATLRVLPAGQPGAAPLATSTGGRIEAILPVGSYTVEAALGPVSTTADVTLGPGETAQTEIILEVGYVIAEALAAEGTDPLSGATFSLSPADAAAGPDNEIARGGGRRAVFTVAPGQYRITGRFGLAETDQLVRVAANRVTPVSLTLNAARLDLDAIGPDVGTGLGAGTPARYRIFRDGPDGSIEPIAEIDSAAPSVRLAAGTYTVDAERNEQRARETVSLRAGERAGLRLLLGAGAASITARADGKPIGDTIVDVAAAPVSDAGIDTGPPVELGALSGKTMPLPAGRYRLSGRLIPGRAQAETIVTIEPGVTSEAELDFDVGTVRLAMLDKPEGAPLADGNWVLRPRAGKGTTKLAGGEVELRLAPGTYRVIARSGERRGESEITVESGSLAVLNIVPE